MTALGKPASLWDCLEDVPDPRASRGRRHDLRAMLAAVCCAVLCGARGFKPIAQWLHDQDLATIHALGFRRTPPRWGAIRKLLIDLDAAAFEQAVARWAEGLDAATASQEAGLQAAAIDGKALRGSAGRHQRSLHLLSVMAQRSALTLRQAEVGAKTNEHKAALELLRAIDLPGRVVTGDAMFCQRDLCRQIVGAGGHYLVVVKENQPDLLQTITDAFGPLSGAAFSPSAAGPDRGPVRRAPHAGEAAGPRRIASAPDDQRA